MSPFRLIGFLIALGVAAAGWLLTCGAWQLSRVAAGVAPLETRHFAAFTVVTLGSGGAYENPDRLGPAAAVAAGETLVLVDAGRGLAETLRAAEIPPTQPTAVLLTSLMGENTVGLDDLLLTGWLEGRERPLRLLGPPGTRDLARSLEAAHREAVRARSEPLGLPPDGARFAAEEIGDGWSGRLRHPAEGGEELAVRAAALPGGPVAALAYRFEHGGRSAVIASAGWAPDALVALARGANLLVHEAVLLPTPEQARELGIEADPERLRREAALHTSVADVGVLAQRAGVATLALVRLRPPPVFDIQLTSRVDDHFGGRIVIAADGDELRP